MFSQKHHRSRRSNFEFKNITHESRHGSKSLNVNMANVMNVCNNFLHVKTFLPNL